MRSVIHKNFKLNVVHNNFFRLFYCSNIILVFVTASILVVNGTTELSNNEFDHLIFSQRWLPSSCISVNDNCKSSNCCKLPEDYTVWSIHGLWPQYKNSFGPFFCNKTLHFNKTLIESIIPALDKYWPNIEKHQSSTSLWKHEWLKHGTCSATLGKLDSELKYFNTSLNLFDKLNLNKLFNSLKILPNDNGVNIMDIFNSLKTEIGKNPFLHCITKANSKDAYLVEVRLCFDLNFGLIDCGTPNNINKKLEVPLSHSVTNCPNDTLTKFPISTDLPSLQNDALKNHKRFLHNQNLNELLKLVRFLMWVSL